MAYIALLDCNNFFASCERLFRPDLKRKPVVVLSSNDGCVVARSKEVKDIGIPMGVPYFQIKDTLKEAKAEVFSSHFALYRDVSRRVFEVVKRDYELVEQYSIDECFILFDSKDPVTDMKLLKVTIEREVGIPVSVGIASSKTQAKYASLKAKSGNGVALISKEVFSEMTGSIRLGEIWGVGRALSVRFTKENVNSVKDLLLLPKEVVARRYGLNGTRLVAELSGQVAYPVTRSLATQKSCMSTRSFAKETSNKDELKDALLYHLHQVVEDLNSMGLATTSVRIMIAPSRYSAYALHFGSSESTLSCPTTDIFELQEIVNDLFLKVYKPGIPYKKAGVILSQLVSSSVTTDSLFGQSEASISTKELTKTMLQINKNMGADVLQLGRLTHKKSVWEVRRELLSPAYTTNWKDIKTVSAK